MGDDIGLVLLDRAHHRPAQPDRLHHVGANLRQPRRVHRARPDRVGFRHAAAGQAGKQSGDADAMGRQFLPQRIRQAQHAELARRIGGEQAEGVEPVHRRCVDDMPRAPVDHRPREAGDAIIDAGQVDRDQPVEIGRVHVDQRHKARRDPGIVAENIHRPEARFRRCPGLRPAIAPGDVDRQRHRVRPRRQLRRLRLGKTRVDIGQDDAPALLGKGLRHPPADTAAAPGDEYRPARDLHPALLLYLRQYCRKLRRAGKGAIGPGCNCAFPLPPPASCPASRRRVRHSGGRRSDR